MRLEDDIDFTTLSWVKRELDETLNQARLALQAFVEDPSDTSQMRFCATYLHQVQGTLAMVELHGAALVVDEMEQSATALLEDAVEDKDSAFDVMIRGMVQLPDYLERLQSGHRDIPIVLLPLLNEIRGIRGEKPVSEVALFAPRLDVDLPIAGPAHAVPDVKLRAATVKLRKAFEASLLGWLRAGSDSERVTPMLARMIAICDKLASITHAETPRRLWWIASGIIEGVKVGAISVSRDVKLAIGKVDQEMKRQALKGERAMVTDSTDRLSRQLLFFAASEPRTPCLRLTELNGLFGLSLLVPDESEVQHAKGSMTGHNRELLDTVASAIKEDLMRVKDGLDFKVRQGDMSSQGYDPLIEHLEKIADTLGMLGLEGPQTAVVEERDRMRRFSEGAAEASEESLMDVASAMLYVEAALDNYIDRLGSEQDESVTLDSDLSSAEVRRILDALMKESSENLQEIKRNIIDFIEAPWDHERVKETPRLLQEIVGALKMLDLGDASELLQSVVRFISAELIAKRSVPSAEQLDTLADAVASIEYFLEAVREHRPGKNKILEVARSSLARLGYLGEDGERKAAQAIEAAEALGDATGEAVAEEPETVVMPAIDPSQFASGDAETEASADAASAEAVDGGAGEDEQGESEAEGGDEVAEVQPAQADIDDDIDDEIREVFIEEVEEELAALDTLFPKWRSDPDDQETLGTIRRTFHTLKGSGRLVGAHTIGEFSWQIENLLNRLLDGTRETTPAVTALLGAAVAALPELLANVKGEGRPATDIEAIKAVAEKLASGEEALLAPEAPPAEAASGDEEPQEVEYGELEVVDFATLDDADMGDLAEEIGQAPVESASDDHEDEPDLETLLDEPADVDEAAVSGETMSPFDGASVDEPEETASDELEPSDIDVADRVAAEEEADEVDEAIRQFEQDIDDSGIDVVDEASLEAPTEAQSNVDDRDRQDGEAVDEWIAAEGEEDDGLTTADADYDLSAMVEAMEPPDSGLTPDTPETVDELGDLEAQLDALDEEGLVDEIAEAQDDEPESEHTAEDVEEAVAEEDEFAAAEDALIDPVLLDILRSEVAGHLVVMEKYLGQYRASDSAMPVSEPLLRAVHTLNGAVAMVDVGPLTTITGPLERYVKQLRLLEQAPSAEGIDALEQSISIVRKVVDQLEFSKPHFPDSHPLGDLLSALSEALPEPGDTTSLFPVEMEEELARTEAEAALADLENAGDSAEADAEIEAHDVDEEPAIGDLASAWADVGIDQPAEIQPEGEEPDAVAPADSGDENASLDESPDAAEWVASETARDLTDEDDLEALAAAAFGEDGDPVAEEDDRVGTLDATSDAADAADDAIEVAIDEEELADLEADLAALDRDADAAELSESMDNISDEAPEGMDSGLDIDTLAGDSAEDRSESEAVETDGGIELEEDTELLFGEVAEPDSEGLETVEPDVFEGLESALDALDETEAGGGTESEPSIEDQLAALDEADAEAEPGPELSLEDQLAAFDDADAEAEAEPELSLEDQLAALDEADDDAEEESEPELSLEDQLAALDEADADAEEESEAELSLEDQLAALDEADADAEEESEAELSLEDQLAALDEADADAEEEAEAELSLEDQLAALDEADADAEEESEAELSSLEDQLAALDEANAEEEVEPETETEPSVEDERAAFGDADGSGDLDDEAAGTGTFEVTAQGEEDETTWDLEAVDDPDLTDAEHEEAVEEPGETEASADDDSAWEGEPVAAFEDDDRIDEDALAGAIDELAAETSQEALGDEDDDEEVEVSEAVAAFIGSIIPTDEPEQIGIDTLGDLDEELLEIFVQEGEEILDEADHRMVEFRASPDEASVVTALQRELHTLKGGARMAGISPIGDLSHSMESLFEKIVEKTVVASPPMVELLEHAFDRLHQMLDAVTARGAIPGCEEIVRRMDALSSGESVASLVEGQDDSAAPAEPIGEAVETVETAASAIPVAARQTALDQEAEQRGGIAARAQQEVIRVRADLLDNLVNYAGEVSIYRARLDQQIGTFRFNLVELDQTVSRLRDQLRKLEIETEAQILSRYQREGGEFDQDFDPLELDRFSQLQQYSRALAESVADLVSIQSMLDDVTRGSETLLLQQSRVNSDLQEGLMRTRMVPFDSLVPRLRRILRQTTQELGKKALLRVEGAQGEMDRTVLERVTAPLEHMLRNAVAHGLETPEGRARQGKGEEGSIVIKVSREATEVVLRVIDDGAGIDPDRVRAKAIERGMLKEGADLTERDLYGFILQSGFSTAEDVSKIAGRGVGMDVVNSEIKQLGGSLDISSSRGEGSTFTIRLPFTLAVTHAIMVRIGDATFAIPLSSIEGVVRMKRDEFEGRLAEGDTMYEYAGDSYQLHELDTLLGLDRKTRLEDDMLPILMSRIGDQRAGIRIDSVMSSREIVVKSVGPQISSIPGIFGATILGDGSVIMILDLGPLIRRGAALRLDAIEAGTAHTPVEVTESVEQRQPVIMVVDDSITMRKVTTRVLERHDMEAITAKDGVDAVEQLQERIPDLMLLDIEMPRMDGYELATHMRNDPRLKDIPIIMITSRTGEKHRQRAFEIGVNRYLGKPYQEAELLENVTELLAETIGAG